MSDKQFEREQLNKARQNMKQALFEVKKIEIKDDYTDTELFLLKQACDKCSAYANQTRSWERRLRE